MGSRRMAQTKTFLKKQKGFLFELQADPLFH